MNPILITIFTPANNQAHLLTQLFQTLKQQIISDREWLIVDDESFDDTATVVQRIRKEKTGLRVL